MVPRKHSARQDSWEASATKGRSLKACDAQIDNGRPNTTFAIFEEGLDGITRETVRVGGIITVTDESILFPIKLQKPGALCAKPEISPGILEYRGNASDGRAGRVTVIERVVSQRVCLAVKDCQTVSGSMNDPKDTKTIFVERDLAGRLAERNMQGYFCGFAIELI